MNIFFSTFCINKLNGTYFRAYYLARELAKRGHNITLASISPNSKFKKVKSTDYNLKIIEYPNLFHKLIFHFGNGPLDIALRTKHLMNGNYDIVHGFEYYANVNVPILLTKKIKKYVYVSDWCDWFSKGMAAKGRRFASWSPIINAISKIEDVTRLYAHGVTVISDEIEQHVRSIGIPDEKILRVTGGSPTDLIKPLSKMKSRRELGYPLDANICLFLGNYQADLDIFVRAFQLLTMKNPKTRLVIIGLIANNISKLIKELGLEQNIIEVGTVEPANLGKYMASADLFLLPLRDTEGNRSRWPNKIGDYMASGRPIVASQVGEIVSIMKTNNIGMLVQNNINEIATNTEWLLNNPELADEMGSNARALAETEYSWSSLAEQLESFYSSLLN